MTTDTYILKDKRPVPEPNIIKWGQWMGTSLERIIAQDRIGNVRVSTVFLGFDHSFGEGGLVDAPVLFETMVFGGALDQEQRRYTIYRHAILGHGDMCARVILEQHPVAIFKRFLHRLRAWSRL